MEQNILVRLNDELKRWLNHYIIDSPPTPMIDSIIIEENRCIFRWKNPKQVSIGLVDYLVPRIDNIILEYKTHKNGTWSTQIPLNSTTVNEIQFIRSSNNFPETGYLDNNTWYEYNAFKCDDKYLDIRIYGINPKSDTETNIHPYTYINLCFHDTVPTTTVKNFQNDPPTELSYNDYYIIGKNPTGVWSNFAGYIAIAISNINKWKFIKPRDNWKIENFLYQNNEWIDLNIIEILKLIQPLSEDTDCSICFEELKTNENHIITKCNHKFHKNCLLAWYEEKKKITCPMCRSSI